MNFRERLHEGLVMPACPLALNASRKWDESRQRALLRYYAEAGAGGIAVGVHTTQFNIRRPSIGLYQPLLEMAAKTSELKDMVRVAGLCGGTGQAVAEATFAREQGYHAGLLSLGGMSAASEPALLEHCRAVAEIIPLFGFYLQPAAGGRILPFSFWARFCEIPQVVAIKIAPFNRYQTIEVVRAVVETSREDIALYTGNDDNIINDLVTPFRFFDGRGGRERRIAGGLLGQWAVWTKRAVEILHRCREAATKGAIEPELLRLNVELTDANSAIFDAANNFVGCIPGIHEVLRRQGLLEGIWCLDPNEGLSPGQNDEIARVWNAYPHLRDDEFVAERLHKWLR